MSHAIDNLFHKLPISSAEEEFISLLQGGRFKLERIVSKGHQTPPGQWYDQQWHEWVLLLSGSAGLRIEHQDEIVLLGPGDCINIPAHQRHRVEWTDEKIETIWLALHYEDESSNVIDDQ